MNKSAIPWCDVTWNPIVGCEGMCPWCYARRIARTRLAHLCPSCATFIPHLHAERLLEPVHIKKPALVFADSMSDLWGPGIDPEWRNLIRHGMALAPWHQFVILTKRPDLITRWDVDCWLDNAWLGVSITSGKDWWRWEALATLPEDIHKLVSVEPLLGPLDIRARMQPTGEAIRGGLWHGTGHYQGQNMELVIVGPQSGPGVIPVDPTWQQSIRDACATLAIPLFEKFGLPLQPPVRQMPAELKAVFQKGGLDI